MNEQTGKEEHQVSYCCAYWDWLRGKRAMIPTALEWGLDELDAQLLRAQCDIESKAQGHRRKGLMPEPGPALSAGVTNSHRMR